LKASRIVARPYGITARWSEIKPASVQSALSIAREVATVAASDAAADTGYHQLQGRDGMAKGEQKGNREKKKPKKEKIKTIAAAPSQKGVGGLQSGFGKKK
jgi:hypothetical protein